VKARLRDERGPACRAFVTGYGFHPEASVDLSEIWKYSADIKLDAANR
jgi:hypothetical protein